jgi:hypothetical protein
MHPILKLVLLLAFLWTTLVFWTWMTTPSLVAVWQEALRSSDIKGHQLQDQAAEIRQTVEQGVEHANTRCTHLENISQARDCLRLMDVYLLDISEPGFLLELAQDHNRFVTDMVRPCDPLMREEETFLCDSVIDPTITALADEVKEQQRWTEVLAAEIRKTRDWEAKQRGKLWGLHVRARRFLDRFLPEEG